MDSQGLWEGALAGCAGSSQRTKKVNTGGWERERVFLEEGRAKAKGTEVMGRVWTSGSRGS